MAGEEHKTIPMKIPWKSYEIPLEIQRSSCGIPMRIPWKTYKIPMELIWKSHGFLFKDIHLEFLKDSYGNPKIIWTSYKMFH